MTSILNIVAEELGVEDYTQSEVKASLNGVTSVQIYTGNKSLRVHLVRDSELTDVTIEEGSKLAAFYNKKFWHEVETKLKLNIACEKYLTGFQIKDDDSNHSVFVTEISEEVFTQKLTVDHVFKLAQHMAKLHAVDVKKLGDKFLAAIAENHENIRKYKQKLQKSHVEMLEFAVSSDLKRFFSHADKLVNNFKTLLSYEFLGETAKSVVCHGNLTQENCHYNLRGDLVEIEDWENIHLGNPTEDLASFMINTLDTRTRNAVSKKVLHVYYYTLVDLKPPGYQLHDLNRWYQQSQAYVVIDRLESVLETISAELGTDDIKTSTAHRWEAALEEAVKFVHGRFNDNKEQFFFAGKE